MGRFVVEAVAVASLAVVVAGGAAVGGAAVEGTLGLAAAVTWLGWTEAAWRAGRRAEVEPGAEEHCDD